MALSWQFWPCLGNTGTQVCAEQTLSRVMLRSISGIPIWSLSGSQHPLECSVCACFCPFLWVFSMLWLCSWSLHLFQCTGLLHLAMVSFILTIDWLLFSLSFQVPCSFHQVWDSVCRRSVGDAGQCPVRLLCEGQVGLTKVYQQIVRVKFSS